MPIHPFSKVSDQSVSDDKRYTQFLDRMQWPLRRLLITDRSFNNVTFRSKPFVMILGSLESARNGLSNNPEIITHGFGPSEIRTQT